MIGWVIAAGILLIIALLPVGAVAEYSAEGYWVKLLIGPFRKQLLPKAEKQRERKPKKKKATAEKAKAKSARSGERKTKKGGTVDYIIKLIRLAIDELGLFKKRLLIKNLTVHYTAASSDPFSTAMQFGGCCAGAGTLMALIRYNFRVRNLDLASDVDFDAKTPSVFLAADLRIAVWAVLGLVLRFVIRFLKESATRKASALEATRDTTTQGKVETING